MPGKQVGLSESCWPDRLIGSLPNFYLYAANNPSEGLIAKRRSAATLVSYLTPPVIKADLNIGLQELKELIERWRCQPSSGNKTDPDLAKLIETQADSLDLIDTPWVTGDVENHISELSSSLTEIEQSLIPYGMHVVGEVIEEDQQVDLLQALAKGSYGLDLDQEEVARIAQEYDLVVVPVIDKHLKLIGRVTLDDLVDVIVEEHNEDLGHLAGTGHEEVTETSVLRTSGDRLPWLLIGLFGGFLTAIVMSFYENAIISLPDVAYFIPLVAALGGSIGIQSSTIVVRGLATGAIQTTDILIRLWKELRVGLLNGMVCSIILTLMSFYLTSDLGRALTSGISLLIVVCFAATVGSTIPIILKRMNIDPALAMGPFITTTNDIIGIAIYLGLAFNVSFSSLIST